jgi:hypothetical protein
VVIGARGRPVWVNGWEAWAVACRHRTRVRLAVAVAALPALPAGCATGPAERATPAWSPATGWNVPALADHRQRHPGP